MINKRLLLLLLIILLGLLAIVISRSLPQNKIDLSHKISTHPLFYFEERSFYKGIEHVKKENKSFSSHIKGGIIPHHLFPSYIIAGFFNGLSKLKPKTIILVGPNHFERGDFKALSSIYGWETPFGIVYPNDIIINELVGSNLIEIDEDVLPKDHAVAGIMPFVKYYLPNTNVVPILLSGFMTEEDIRVLSNNLKKYISEDTIIISAVDFSHYLTSPQAQEKDEVTLKLIEDFNYQKILSLNNEYLDSPPSIVTLLMTMDALGTKKFEVLHHTNSGEIQKNNSIETTSYFSVAFH